MKEASKRAEKSSMGGHDKRQAGAGCVANVAQVRRSPHLTSTVVGKFSVSAERLPTETEELLHEAPRQLPPSARPDPNQLSDDACASHRSSCRLTPIKLGRGWAGSGRISSGFGKIRWTNAVPSRLVSERCSTKSGPNSTWCGFIGATCTCTSAAHDTLPLHGRSEPKEYCPAQLPHGFQSSSCAATCGIPDRSEAAHFILVSLTLRLVTIGFGQPSPCMHSHLCPLLCWSMRWRSFIANNFHRTQSSVSVVHCVSSRVSVITNFCMASS